MTDTVLFEKHGHVARIVLNNPARHNSLGEIELAALQRHADTVQRDNDIRVLVVTGAGDQTFCAGAALHELGQQSIGSGGAVALQGFFQNVAMLIAVGSYTYAASQQVDPAAALIGLGSLVFVATFFVSLRLPEQTTES